MAERPVDQAIREAIERGEFENLPGKGKPLPDSGPVDDMWWVRQFALREEAGEAFLPTSLLLRKEAADLPERVRKLPNEAAVRIAVTDLNARIRAEIRLPTGGPPLSMRAAGRRRDRGRLAGRTGTPQTGRRAAGRRARRGRCRGTAGPTPLVAARPELTRGAQRDLPACRLGSVGPVSSRLCCPPTAVRRRSPDRRAATRARD